MKITIETTDELHDLGRICTGRTESGHEVVVFVTAIGVPAGAALNPALEMEIANLGATGIRAVQMTHSPAVVDLWNREANKRRD